MVTAHFVNKGVGKDTYDTRVIINPSQGIARIQVGDMDSDITFNFNFATEEVTISGEIGNYSNNYLSAVVGCILK